MQRREFVPLETAPSQLVAEMWREVLGDEGIVALLKPGDAFVHLGVAGQPCRVFVPGDQVERARALLRELAEAPSLVDEADWGEG